MAVGYKADGGGGLAESWNGTAWKILPNPKTPGIEASVNSISCSSASACTAVGSYLASGGVTGALVERWNGTRWAVQPSLVGSGLVAVSCPSAKSCTAIGGPQGLNAEQWNGTTWSLLPDAPPAGDDSFLLGLSCISADTCTAVGQNFPSGTNGSTAVAERWNGSNWTIQQTAALPGANNAELDSVSCTATHACVAVGYNDIGKPTAAMAEEWDGTSWTVDNPIPGPATATASQLSGVSCLGGIGGACAAVGTDSGPQGGNHAFAVTK